VPTQAGLDAPGILYHVGLRGMEKRRIVGGWSQILPALTVNPVRKGRPLTPPLIKDMMLSISTIPRINAGAF
jgi:hypothetical protein